MIHVTNPEWLEYYSSLYYNLKNQFMLFYCMLVKPWELCIVWFQVLKLYRLTNAIALFLSTVYINFGGYGLLFLLFHVSAKSEYIIREK